MTRTAPSQISFASGEISPLLAWRSDYQRQQSGLSTCRGFLPLPEGAITRAPGTLWLGAPNNATARLIPFKFAQDDACVIELTPTTLRVWRYGALVMTGAGTPYAISTPWTATDLPNLQWVQSADVIYIADGRQPVQVLSRFALDNWTIAPLQLNRGPFRVQNLTKSRTLQASAATGSVTLTAGWNVFTAAHVGSLYRLRTTDNTTVPLWTSNETLTVGDLRRYGNNVYELTVGTNAGQNPPIHDEGTAAVDNSTKWKFLSDNEGILRITAVTNATTAIATVIKRIPKGCIDDPTYRWSEGAWSAIHGYPRALELFDQRLVAAATPAEPRTLWFSAVGDYADFLDGTEADSPFAYTIAGQDSVNRILTLRRQRDGLAICALGEEYITRSESRAQSIGPTTAVFEPVGTNGSNGARPVAPDGDPIFIAADGRRLLLLTYDLQRDSTRAINLTTPARHLGDPGFRELAWAAVPLPMIWVRRGNGTLAAVSYDPSEEVLGWATVPIAGGAVQSLAVTPNATGDRDVLTMIVTRTLDGKTVTSVEELAPIFALETRQTEAHEACHLFAARRFDATVTGLASFNQVTHAALANTTVHAWTDRGAYQNLVAGPTGTITFPANVSYAWVGLFDDTHRAVTLDIPAAAANGGTHGRLKRIKRAGIVIDRTSQGYATPQFSSVGRQLNPALTEGAPMPLIDAGQGAYLTILRSGIVPVGVVTDPAHEVRLKLTPHSGAPLTIAAITPLIEEHGE